LLGDNHPLVAGALADLSWVLGEKSTEGEALETEALVIQRRILGDDHPDVARSIYVLGERMRRTDDLTEAHAVLNAALSIQRKLLGEEHPDVLATLLGLGSTLEKEGNWAEAEVVRRQSLELIRKRDGPEDNQALWAVEALVRTLREQKKLDEAEKVLAEALTPKNLSKPESLKLLFQRTDIMGRQGRWKEAAADAARCVEHQPAEHYNYHMLAPLLVVTRNRPAYEQLCQKLLLTFTNTTNPYWAQRVAIDCLLLPNSEVDLDLIDALSDTSVSRGGEETAALPYFHVCKAMSSYRLNRHTDALSWAEKALSGNSAHASAQACAILSMVNWQLGRQTEARAMLAKGEALVPNITPERGVERVGGSWVAWLIARIALNEAAEIIRSQPPEKNVNQP